MKIAIAAAAIAALSLIPSGAEAKTCSSPYTGATQCGTRYTAPTQTFGAVLHQGWNAKVVTVQGRTFR